MKSFNPTQIATICRLLNNNPNPKNISSIFANTEQGKEYMESIFELVNNGYLTIVYEQMVMKGFGDNNTVTETVLTFRLTVKGRELANGKA